MLITICGALKLSLVDHGVLSGCRARMSLLPFMDGGDNRSRTGTGYHDGDLMMAFPVETRSPAIGRVDNLYSLDLRHRSSNDRA